jgi:hypothetical protein
MHPLTALVCGKPPEDGTLKDVMSHLATSLDNILSRIPALKASEDPAETALFGPYLGRSALEVALTAIMARFDPYRILAIRRTQLSTEYDLQARSPIAFKWADDVQGKDKCKEWSALPNVDAVQRALLCNHFHDLFWEEAFIKMLDATQLLPFGEWMSRLRNVDPPTFTMRNRAEAAKLYSALSKAIHHEFVIPMTSQYDLLTVNDLLGRTLELIGALSMTACFSPALRDSDVDFSVSCFTSIEKEFI